MILARQVAVTKRNVANITFAGTYGAFINVNQAKITIFLFFPKNAHN